jgi:putative DNA methylase
MRQRKKLIEVALPLEAINKASAREKSIRHGHPSTLHLWWARRPLAAARAVIFAQMVDDPSEYVDVLRTDAKLRRKAETALKARLKLWEEARALAVKAKGSGLLVTEPGPAPTLDDILADQERQRLFRIIEALVLWENTTNETVLQTARDEIWQSWRRACADNSDHPTARELFDRNKLPAFHDPFAGGGALPLEAQRLGLESYASDLNPVAVLINKAMIEIPPKFAGQPPVNPESREEKSLFEREWVGTQGLAEDVRYYGKWMRDEAEKRIGHLYPKIEITKEMVKERPDLKPNLGQNLTVIAWIWARTVKSPNPAFSKVDVPLASTFMLSTKAGKEAYVEPVIEKDGFHFRVKVGKPTNLDKARNGTKLSRGSFRCLMSDVPISYEYIDDEANAGRMGNRLMAVVAEGERARIYLSPTTEMEAVAMSARPTWKPDVPSRGTWASNAQGRKYGFQTFGDYFTPRQLVALTTFSTLIEDARKQAATDAIEIGNADDEKRLDKGGSAATAYGDAIGVYLAFAVDRMANTVCTIARWTPERQQTVTAFSRQGIAMTWDYPEVNPFGGAAGDYSVSVEGVIKGISSSTKPQGTATQADASKQDISAGKVISTDPPYYDNVGYADLSDFFYVWLRRALNGVFPELFSTVAVPKTEELVACSYRHGGRGRAEAFFLSGMTETMQRLADQAHPAFPVTIYYAFKQTESDGVDGTTNTGWDTFVGAVIEAGFSIGGTWPIRTELANKLIGFGANMLASSIVLSCRRRSSDARSATRREFVTALKAELPRALAYLQAGNIAPVDLAQAAIGPGMAVYTRFTEVQHAEGKKLTVREALAIINQSLDEVLAAQEGDFDADSRWALTWFEQTGFDFGPYGQAEQLSKSKNTSVEGMEDAGILELAHGKVRLLRPEELPSDWDPAGDSRLSEWEIVHHVIRVLATEGEGAAGQLVARLSGKAEVARELAYRLYTLCDRKKRVNDALMYNGLVQSWSEISRLAIEAGKPHVEQVGLFARAED